MDFIIVNGKVVSREETNLTDFLLDEPFIISQKVWYGFGGIPLFNENVENLESQLKTFNRTLPNLFKNKRELFRITKRMLNKNKYYRSGYILFQLFISATTIHSIISSSAFSAFSFPFAKEGLLVDFSTYTKNSNSVLAKYKCHNQLLWNSAKAHLIHTNCQNSILLNEKSRICEGIGSNVFLIKEKTLITPSFETGCYTNLLRSLILDIAAKLRLKIIETPEIQKEHLFEMDEVFFVSEEFGFQWVLGIENKRYVHEYSDKFHEELDELLKKKVS